MKIPHAHFGRIDQQLDWRKAKTNSVDADEVVKPPSSIIELLKLNPLDLFEIHNRHDAVLHHLKKDIKE